MLLQLSILINFTAVVQAIILIVLLLRKKYAGYLYNRFLAILLGAFCIPIINTLRVFLGYEYSLEFFDTLTNSMLLIIPPTIYLYVKNKLEESDLWFKALSLHGIPFIVLFVLFSTLLIFRIDYLDELENIFLPVYLIQNAVYLALTFKLIRRFEKDDINQKNTQIKKSVSWMKQIMISYTIVYVLSIASILFNFTGNRLPDIISLNFILILSLHIIGLTYRNLSDSDVFFRETPYSKSQLSSKKAKEIFSQIKKLMDKEKVFRSKELTLSQLAKELDIASSYISQSINREEGVGFNDFVNQYRVEDVKEKLSDPSFTHLTMLGIAESAGFKSGSVFNTAFKKYTGTTPSKYKKSLSQ